MNRMWRTWITTCDISYPITLIWKISIYEFSAEYTETSFSFNNFAAVILWYFSTPYHSAALKFSTDLGGGGIPAVSIASGCQSDKEGIRKFTRKCCWSPTKVHGTTLQKTTTLKEKALAISTNYTLTLQRRPQILKGNALLSTYQTIR
jgi:hypothetical protein